MDVVKSRLQKGEDGTSSARVLLSRIWKEEGYRGIFRVSSSITSISIAEADRYLGILDEYRSMGVSFICFRGDISLTKTTGLKYPFIGCSMNLSRLVSYLDILHHLPAHHPRLSPDSRKKV